jgi:hypothetical protein
MKKDTHSMIVKVLPSSAITHAAGSGGSIGVTVRRENLTYRKRAITTKLTLRRLFLVVLDLQRMLTQLQVTLI